MYQTMLGEAIQGRPMSEPWRGRVEIGDAVLYLGDARDILPTIGPVDSVITDPVWPNAHPDLQGSENPVKLFAETISVLPRARALLVWLGIQSDPRFLRFIPSSWPFLRVSYLSRAVPGYNGRCLVTGDLLYAYGEWPASKEGRRVIPGEKRVTSKPLEKIDHPCARNLEQAKWVVYWWTDKDEIVLDPFCGSGTIGCACTDLGRRYIGIEIEDRYFDIACARIKAAQAQLRLPFDVRR
jgi:hypothetical protein